MRYSTPEAIDFLRRGTLALSAMEHNGVRVDKGYVEQTHKDLDDRVRDIYRRLKADREMYKPWVRRFGSATNLGSRDQLADVLFKDLGIEPKGLTRTGKLATDKSVLDKIDLPGVKLFREMESLKDIQSTYLDGIRREMVETADGWFVHPSYGLNVAATFRSVCKEPNWQNIPSRDYELAQLVRRCYIPRKGRYLVEVDFGMVEVRMGCPYHHDPNMIRYCTDPNSDMHRDIAMKMFFLPADTVMQMKKTVRHAAKNMFVFPEFYGSTWFNCAPQIWDAVQGWKLPDGTPLVKHLRRNGVKELGSCEKDGGGRPGTFAGHVKAMECYLWDKQFPVYRDWKRSWYDQYQREGGLSMLTGFRVNARLTRNEVTNFPIQGTAFHCELWTCIEIVRLLRKYKMDSLLVGQIHDCDVGDVTKSELQAYCDMVYGLKTRELPKAWKWINVPMEAEVEVSGRNDSWATKKEWVRRNGEWSLKG
jgi:DNA polymerase I-like protein with 3'-5' exonuclease and polymerase domains